MSDETTQTMTGIPNDKVSVFVEILKNDPRYLSHTVTRNTDGTSTITVTNRTAVQKEDDDSDSES